MHGSAKLVLGDVVGHGVYGVVKKAVLSASDGRERMVAVKLVRPQRAQGLPENAVREIGILRELQHPHVVELLHVRVRPTEQTVSLILEWAPYDLGDVVRHHLRLHNNASVPVSTKNFKAYMPLSMIRAIVYQLLDAGDYLHSRWIINRDIKPANVLITADGVLKMADFGLARVFQAPPRPLADDHTVVTLWYRAPELLLGSRHYTPAIDVWSLGAILGELILLQAVFRGTEPSKGSPVAKEQLLRIFEALGRPDIRVWPSVVEMPFWDEIQKWSESDLANVFAPAEAMQRKRDHLNHMLSASSRNHSPAEMKSAIDAFFALCTYDPMQRRSCSEAKKLPFFAGAERVDNVLAEFGSDWKSFYSSIEKRKCECEKECRKAKAGNTAISLSKP